MFVTMQDIGQAAAIIGVIISLVYLANEIRQNTTTMRRTASMEIVR
jgi:hypothetical protein